MDDDGRTIALIRHFAVRTCNSVSCMFNVMNPERRADVRERVGSDGWIAQRRPQTRLGLGVLFSNIFQNIEGPAHFRIREYSREYT